MLPLSYGAFKFVDRIFANHGNNVTLAELRTQFLRIDTFYMTQAELAIADKSARLVAREWMPHTPIDDIKEEDVVNTSDVNEESLFDDNAHPDNSSTPTTVSNGRFAEDLSSPNATLIDADSEDENSEDEMVSSSASFLSISSSASSGADDELLITPETRPIEVPTAVSDIPEFSLEEQIDLENSQPDSGIRKRRNFAHDTNTVSLQI